MKYTTTAGLEYVYNDGDFITVRLEDCNQSVVVDATELTSQWTMTVDEAIALRDMLNELVPEEG